MIRPKPSGSRADGDAQDQALAAARALRRAVGQRPGALRAVEDVRIRLADGERSAAFRPVAVRAAFRAATSMVIVRSSVAVGGRGACRPDGPRDATDVRSPRRVVPSGSARDVIETESRQRRDRASVRGHGRRRRPSLAALDARRLPPDGAAPRGGGLIADQYGPLLGGRLVDAARGPPPRASAGRRSSGRSRSSPSSARWNVSTCRGRARLRRLRARPPPPRRLLALRTHAARSTMPACGRWSATSRAVPASASTTTASSSSVCARRARPRAEAG